MCIHAPRNAKSYQQLPGKTRVDPTLDCSQRAWPRQKLDCELMTPTVVRQTNEILTTIICYRSFKKPVHILQPERVKAEKEKALFTYRALKS